MTSRILRVNYITENTQASLINVQVHLFCKICLRPLLAVIAELSLTLDAVVFLLEKHIWITIKQIKYSCKFFEFFKMLLQCLNY